MRTSRKKFTKIPIRRAPGAEYPITAQAKGFGSTTGPMGSPGKEFDMKTMQRKTAGLLSIAAV
ncbi:hypothetical protein, partial [Glutamicibacter sp.]|uniref:hypothetical protein n=1 Tax=Glutamicibacter sp. TaxID=1931995 RepID=UPI002FE256FA